LPLNHEANLTLDKITDHINTYLKSNPAIKRKRSQIKAIANLKKDHPNTKFVPADKNLGLTAIDILDYDYMIKVHLNDLNTYKRVNNFNLATQYIEYKKIINYISTKSLASKMELTAFNNIKQNNVTIPNFYVLPKLHKGIHDLNNIRLVPTRPIVGATNWFTTPISIYLDTLLQPYIKSLKHILKNSTTLTEKLNLIDLNTNQFSENCLLVSFDVKSLYTNMDINKIPNLLKQFSTEFDLNTDLLLKLVEYVLSNNFIIYNEDIYKQINGIPMGTNAAVALANIYLYLLIDKYLIKQDNVNFYHRFIDDLFFIYNNSNNNLDILFNKINNIDPSLKFTKVVSKDNLEFLDINIRIIYGLDNKKYLEYETHQKSLNKYLYLTPQSCHNLPTLKGFIKGELIRYNRLSSNPLFFNKIKELFKIRLFQRGYSFRFLSNIFNEITYNKNKLNHPPKLSKVLPLTIPYSLRKNLTKLPSILKQFENSFTKFLPGCKFIVVFSTTPSMSNLLTGSKISSFQNSTIKKKRKNNSNSPLNAKRPLLSEDNKAKRKHSPEPTITSKKILAHNLTINQA
jgi:hypothetical protein